jgi:anti-sigma factor RsiW
MKNETRHFEEELSELIDNRLDAVTRAEVEAHLTVCTQCRTRREWLRRVKTTLAGSAGTISAPPDLGAQIGRVLDREDRRTSAAPWHRQLFLLAASVLLVVGVAAVFFLTRSGRVPSVQDVAEDFRAYQAKRLTLDLKTASPKELEAFFVSRGIPFPARVFDFGMMSYDLVGGRIHAQAGRPTALYAYRVRAATADNVMVCQMFPGLVRELPTPNAVRHHNDIAFHVFREGELTLVFWQEGDIICVLTADGDPETVVQFAFAKAVRV